eukprot:COSAG02_NODE_94_length_37427_cov_79.161728_6_plen_663_part_00
MPPKGRGGRGRGRGGRGTKGGGRGGRAQSSNSKSIPPAKRAKQNSVPGTAAAGGAAQPARKSKVGGGAAKGPGKQPAGNQTKAAQVPETTKPKKAQSTSEAKPAAPVQHRTPAPSTPAAAPSGDRAARIDSALKQILASPSPNRMVSPTTVATTITAAAGASSRDQTQCRPWSRDDFFVRVKTFKPSYWFAPPSQLSPMVCARFGWICVSTDALACRSCECRITYRAPVSDSDQEWTSTIDAFTQRLSDAHKFECPWRKEPCPSGFLEFPPSDGDKLFASFLSRLQDLLQYQRETSWLPRVQSIAQLAPGGEIEELAADRPAPRNLAALAGFPETLADTAHAACMLALFGWTIRISNAQHGLSSCGSSSPLGPIAPNDDCNGVLQCDLCGRTCGVWNFSALMQSKLKHHEQKVAKQTGRSNKLQRTQPPPLGGKTPSAVERSTASLSAAAATPHTFDIVSSYKRGRHPSLGGFEPQLVGHYAASIADTQPDSGQSSPRRWSGHFTAEALLWDTPLRAAGDSRPNKRLREEQSRYSAINAPSLSDDSDMEDSEADADDEIAGCFDARLEHRSFCPWVGDGAGSRTFVVHPGWRQTRTVVLMEIKRRQRSDLPFHAVVAAGSMASTGEGEGKRSAGQMGLDTTSVWEALRRSLHAVRCDLVDER